MNSQDQNTTNHENKVKQNCYTLGLKLTLETCFCCLELNRNSPDNSPGTGCYRDVYPTYNFVR